MDNNHPINPSLELLERCIEISKSGALIGAVCMVAAQWGADQELEACCDWIPKKTPWDAEKLRAARRPILPSLKEQALQELNFMQESCIVDVEVLNTIRAALEAT